MLMDQTLHELLKDSLVAAINCVIACRRSGGLGDGSYRDNYAEGHHRFLGLSIPLCEDSIDKRNLKISPGSWTTLDISTKSKNLVVERWIFQLSGNEDPDLRELTGRKSGSHRRFKRTGEKASSDYSLARSETQARRKISIILRSICSLCYILPVTGKILRVSDGMAEKEAKHQRDNQTTSELLHCKIYQSECTPQKEPFQSPLDRAVYELPLIRTKYECLRVSVTYLLDVSTFLPQTGAEEPKSNLFRTSDVTPESPCKNGKLSSALHRALDTSSMKKEAYVINAPIKSTSLENKSFLACDTEAESADTWNNVRRKSATIDDVSMLKYTTSSPRTIPHRKKYQEEGCHCLEFNQLSHRPRLGSSGVEERFHSAPLYTQYLNEAFSRKDYVLSKDSSTYQLITNGTIWKGVLPFRRINLTERQSSSDYMVCYDGKNAERKYADAHHDKSRPWISPSSHRRPSLVLPSGTLYHSPSGSSLQSLSASAHSLFQKNTPEAGSTILVSSSRDSDSLTSSSQRIPGFTTTNSIIEDVAARPMSLHASLLVLENQQSLARSSGASEEDFGLSVKPFKRSATVRSISLPTESAIKHGFSESVVIKADPRNSLFKVSQAAYARPKALTSLLGGELPWYVAPDSMERLVERLRSKLSVEDKSSYLLLHNASRASPSKFGLGNVLNETQSLKEVKETFLSLNLVDIVPKNE